MVRPVHVLRTGSERLCSERNISSHDGEMDYKGILTLSFNVYLYLYLFTTSMPTIST